jgi:hypothetical protein
MTLRSHCKRGHPFTEENIYMHKNKHRHCRTCRAERSKKYPPKLSPERKKLYNDRWNLNNPDYFKKNDLKRLYGMTLDQFNSLLDSQGNTCAICKCVMAKVNVDHDHACCPERKTCGKCIRGLLCDGCNTALGRFKDSKEMLKSAINYLDTYEDKKLCQV